MLIDQVRTSIEEGGLDVYRGAVEELGEDYDPLDVAAATLKMLAGVDRKADIGKGGVSAATVDSGADAEAGMVRIFINVGRNEGVRPGDIVGAIAGEAGIPGRSIGAIDLYDTYAFAEVPQDVGRKVVDALNSTTLRGHALRTEVARPRGK